MSFQNAPQLTELQINDLDRFNKAVAGQLSYAACVVSGYAISGAHELPFFEIEVEGQTRKAYVSGVSQSGADIDSVIVYYFHTEEDVVVYAIAYPSGIDEGWALGSNTIIEKIDSQPSFTDLSYARQVTLVEGD
jgi:hypothetical protein